MKLKSAQELQPQELPYVEAPFFALSKLHAKRIRRGSFGLEIANSPSSERPWRSAGSQESYLQQVERGQLLLVCDWFDPPFSPMCAGTMKARKAAAGVCV
jgi:hypothetical protein